MAGLVEGLATTSILVTRQPSWVNLEQWVCILHHLALSGLNTHIPAEVPYPHPPQRSNNRNTQSEADLERSKGMFREVRAELRELASELGGVVRNTLERYD